MEGANLDRFKQFDVSKQDLLAGTKKLKLIRGLAFSSEQTVACRRHRESAVKRGIDRDKARRARTLVTVHYLPLTRGRWNHVSP